MATIGTEHSLYRQLWNWSNSCIEIKQHEGVDKPVQVPQAAQRQPEGKRLARYRASHDQRGDQSSQSTSVGNKSGRIFLLCISLSDMLSHKSMPPPEVQPAKATSGGGGPLTREMMFQCVQENTKAGATGEE